MMMLVMMVDGSVTAIMSVDVWFDTDCSGLLCWAMHPSLVGFHPSFDGK